MRTELLVLSCVFGLSGGACDPVWRVETVARTRASRGLNPACIAAGLGERGRRVEHRAIDEPQRHLFEIAVGRHRMVIAWSADKPDTVTLAVQEMGGYGGTDTVAEIRAARTELLVDLQTSCGPFDPKTQEICYRARCD